MNKIILLLLLLISYFGFSQTQIYSIYTKNRQLGNLIVERTKKDSLYQIEINSNVSFRIIMKIELTYKINCTYQDDELLFSSSTTYVNGKINSSLKTEKDGNYYEVTRDGLVTKYEKPIRFSGALSYFKEPVDISNIYSDFYGYNKSIERINDHIYKITNPKNGQVSEYFYENGILTKAIIHHFLMTIRLQLIKEE